MNVFSLDGVSSPKSGRKMLHVDLISNGTNINHGLVAKSRSLDSLCSVGSTSSFAYVPIRFDEFIENTVNVIIQLILSISNDRLAFASYPKS